MESTEARAARPVPGAAEFRVRRRVSFLRLLALIPTALVAAADPALAQEMAEESGRRGRPLTLEGAVARALDRAPAVELSARDVGIARASRIGASLRIPVRPHVQAEFRPNVDPGIPGAMPGYGAMAQLPLDLSQAPRARADEANRRGDVALADLELARMDVRLATIEAYVKGRLAEEQVASAENALAIASRVLAATRQREEAGAASEIDVTTAAEAVALSEAELADAQAVRIESYATLAALLDLDPGEQITLTTEVDHLPPVPGRAEIDDAVVEPHPAVEAIDARAALHAATLERLERELAPLFGVYLGVDRAPASPVFGIIGLAVELPWGPRNQGARAVAAAERDAEELRAELVDRGLARSALALREAYEARKTAVERLRDDAVPLAERRLALTEEGYRLGRLDVFRVAMARDDLVRTRAMRINALVAAWQTWIALERALGEQP